MKGEDGYWAHLKLSRSKHSKQWASGQAGDYVLDPLHRQGCNGKIH